MVRMQPMVHAFNTGAKFRPSRNSTAGCRILQIPGGWVAMHSCFRVRLHIRREGTRDMTTLDDKLRELGGGIDEAVAKRQRLAREKQRAAGDRKRPMGDAAMKYVAAIALVLALTAFIRAGALECKVIGESLSPRCLLVGAWLSWPQSAKSSEGKTRRSSAR
jgi:hypothetical protein